MVRSLFRRVRRSHANPFLSGLLASVSRFRPAFADEESEPSPRTKGNHGHATDGTACTESSLKMVNHYCDKVPFQTFVAGWLLALVVGLSAVDRCAAQAPPRDPGREIISSKDPLTAEQVAVVKTFTDYWCGRLSATGSSLE